MFLVLAPGFVRLLFLTGLVSILRLLLPELLSMLVSVLRLLLPKLLSMLVSVLPNLVLILDSILSLSLPMVLLLLLSTSRDNRVPSVSQLKSGKLRFNGFT